MNMLKGLVRTLPQTSLRSLEMALGLTSDAKMVEVREPITAEIEFRHVREAVFAPYMPLFRSRDDGLASVIFAPWIVNALWSALEKSEPDLHAQAQFVFRSLRMEDPTPVAFFRLVTTAAHICNATPEVILPPHASDTDRAAVAEFGRYLDLHRLARQVLARLNDFMGRIDADKAAALRVLFNDASDLDIKGGTRLLEIIFANLDDGSQIIKFVAIVSDRPNDRFLAMSELADFGTRILDRIEADLAGLKSFMGGKGQACDDPGAAGDRVSQCLSQLQAFGHYVELAREGPWGKRVTEAQRVIADLVGHQLKSAEKTLEGVMPMRVERVYGRVKKEVPDYARVPSDEVLAKARGALLFIRKVRHIAMAGGFASLHTKTFEACELTLDAYFTELLALANGDEPFDAEPLLGGFERIADLMEALCGEEKGQLARRRVASSDLMNPSKSVA
jgi:hypothetical protein